MFHSSSTYFPTQSAALEIPFREAERRGYEPEETNFVHVPYGKTVHYIIPLVKISSGNKAKKCLKVSLYRMESGSYELNYYFN